MPIFLDNMTVFLIVSGFSGAPLVPRVFRTEAAARKAIEEGGYSATTDVLEVTLEG